MSGRHARRSRTPEAAGDTGGRSRGSAAPRGDRRGRRLVESWVLVAVAGVMLALVAGMGACTVMRPGGAKAASVARTKTTASAETSAEAPAAEPTAVFAKLKGFDVEMRYPAVPADLIGVGFHQAWNVKATDMVPAGTVHPRDKYESTKQALKADPALKAFMMMSRGRGSSQYSAADCAMRPGAIVLSPVDGVVTLVTTYKLEGSDDYRIEIQADGAPKKRVVLIHIQDVVVEAGDRVEAGLTPVATVRHLKIDSQVNRYLPVPVDHTHIQVNDEGYKLNEAS